MKYFWEATLPVQKRYESLSKNIDRDIVIVGGGIAGILTAYHLFESGFKVTLVEADRLFSGVTSKTTAHITAQHGDIFSTLTLNKSKLYYDSQQQAISSYREIIEKEQIDCDFEIVNDYNYTLDKLKKIKKLYKKLKKIGVPSTFYENMSILGFNALGVIETYNQAIFHPLKFLSQLKKDFEIFENTRILKIDMKNKILYTKDYSIKANKIIMATNYPIGKVKGAYFIKLYKSHSYCVSTKKPLDINGTYQSDSEDGLTFRNQDKKIIIGGLDHRTGRVNSTTKKQRLEEVSKKYFNSGIEYFWDANDVVTYDGLPIVGRFNDKYPDVYIITGFNKWGMTNSMASAKLITDLISNKVNKFEKIFSPQRFNFNFGAFLINIGVSLNNLVIKPLTPAFKSYRKIKIGDGEIVHYRNSKRAVYRDEKNVFHFCSPYCKHLGCQLKFNKNTKTWDCPCHGSRYDIDGNIISSPTVEKLENSIGSLKPQK
jgi:glycine/D-amino acid oxidase-like deaminating enzyme/nitrite reductase/ring-hydroxylating ferredoxin subunit